MALVTSLTTKLNGLGIYFAEYFHKSSPLFSALFYDWDTLLKPSAALKPKNIKMQNALLEDGFTIKWIDTDLRRTGDLVNGAVSAAATTITVDTGEIFRAGDNVFVPSIGTTFVVTAVSGDDLTVSPAVPTGGIADNAKIKVVSSSIDNRGKVDGKSITLEIGTETTNYIQHISRNVSFNQEDLNKILLKYQGVGASGDAAKKYTTEVLEKGLREIQNDFVNAFFVGVKQVETIGGNTYRTTGGLNEYVSETVDCTGSDEAEAQQNIMDVLEGMQGIASTGWVTTNMLVCTRSAASKIAAMTAGNVQITESLNIDKIGMRIKIISTAYGDIPIYIDPVMTDLYDDANMAFALNPKMISIISTSNLPAKEGKDMNAITNLSGIKFYKNNTGALQPNSDSSINLYTNFGFMFQGADMWLYKKLINLGVV